MDIVPDARIDTPAKALEYAQHQIAKVRHAVVEARLAAQADAQRRLYDVALIRYGCALGTLATLLGLGSISEIAFETLRAEAMALMSPKTSTYRQPRARA